VLVRHSGRDEVWRLAWGQTPLEAR
jgi:hypothetical protein